MPAGTKGMEEREAVRLHRSESALLFNERGNEPGVD